MTNKRFDKNIDLIPKDYAVILWEGSTEPQTIEDDEEVVGEGFTSQEWWEESTFKGYDVKESLDIFDYTYYDFDFKEEEYNLVDDVKSLISGIILKLLTIYGELDYFPYEEWGDRVYELIYEVETPMTMSKLEGYIIQALEEMDRIERVDGLYIERMDEKLHVTAQIKPVDEPSEQITLVIE
ncbi:MAG: hypothetical protein H5T41_09830 [Methanomassiliicoccales archaeon]|nr:hypothetical protein [Methanomassiliicoccales archaeon]